MVSTNKSAQFAPATHAATTGPSSDPGGLYVEPVDIEITIKTTAAVKGSVIPLLAEDQESLVAGQTFRFKVGNPGGALNVDLPFTNYCVALEAGAVGDKIKARVLGTVDALVFKATSGTSIAAGVGLVLSAAGADSLKDGALGTAQRVLAKVGPDALTGLANAAPGAVLKTVLFNGFAWGSNAT